MSSSPPRVAVVGAGIAGLSAALRLDQRGIATRIFEAGALGGVLRTDTDQGFLREGAANGFLGHHPRGGLALCRELDVAVEEALPAARQRWIFRNGALRAIPASPRAFARSDLLSRRGKWRLLAEPFLPTRAAGDELTVGQYFRLRLGAEAVDALVHPFVTGVFAGDAEKLSLTAAFPRVAEIARRGGLVRGQLATMLLDESKRGPGSRRLWAPAQGMQALIGALADRLRPNLIEGAQVQAVERQGDSVQITAAGREPEAFDACVLAMPTAVAAPLIASSAPALAGALARFPYAGVAAVHLGYERSDVYHPLDGFGFLVARGEQPRILGALFESAIFSRRAPAGRVLFRVLMGGVHDPEVLALDDAAIIAAARQDLESILNIRGQPAYGTVTRWRHAIPQYNLGHALRVEEAEALAATERVILAGAAYHGVSVNDIIADGTRVAESVGRLLGR